VSDKSLVDSREGTIIWEYNLMIVQLYKGLMKIYANQTSIYEGSSVVVEHKGKDKAAVLEIAKSFILCSHQVYKTHIKSIALFVHNDDRVKVARG
jgi:hypothetical protein